MTNCCFCGRAVLQSQPHHTKLNPATGQLIHFHFECDRSNTMPDLYDQISFAHRRAETIGIIEAGREFWCIWNPLSDKPTRVAYEAEAEAWRVADILARKSPDERFFVLHSLGFTQTAQPVVHHTLVAGLKVKAPIRRK